jgi:Fur family peroxide stress response transcriptional regulator
MLVDIEQRLEQFKHRLRMAGVKLTHQRREIFREVVESDVHPDAEMVFRAVSKRVAGVSVDTVYRTLWLLEDLGLIARLGIRQDSVRFDGNLTPHHHFVCVRCGVAKDFKADETNEVQLPETIGALGDVILTRLEVQGVCRSCLAGTAKAASPGRTRKVTEIGSNSRVVRAKSRDQSMAK